MSLGFWEVFEDSKLQSTLSFWHSEKEKNAIMLKQCGIKLAFR